MNIEGFEAYEAIRKIKTDQIIQLFKETDRILRLKKFSEGTIIPSHDIHGYFRLISTPDQTIHLQGYPGLSTEDEAIVLARLLDFNKALALTESGKVSVGNEHEAQIRKFDNFPTITPIPYNPDFLTNELLKNFQ